MWKSSRDIWERSFSYEIEKLNLNEKNLKYGVGQDRHYGNLNEHLQRLQNRSCDV